MATQQKVTRIKATDSAPKAKAPQTPKKGKNKSASRVGYFKGAWQELRQVRWPNRRATWGLTLAVIIFSLFFVVFIVLLDTLFQYLFELIIT